MRCSEPDFLLFTKLDETESQGAILSAALEAGQAAVVFCQRPKHSRRYRAGPCARVACVGVPAGNSGGRHGGIDGFESISERGLLHLSSGLDTGERDRLILENLPHVRWVAMRIHEKIGGAVSLEDLVSSGVIGLINAVDSYDPKFNVKLKTYAEHRIRGAILDSIRGLDGIPVHKRKRLKDVEAAIASAEQRLQRVPVKKRSPAR